MDKTTLKIIKLSFKFRFLKEIAPYSSSKLLKHHLRRHLYVMLIVIRGKDKTQKPITHHPSH